MLIFDNYIKRSIFLIFDQVMFGLQPSEQNHYSIGPVALKNRHCIHFLGHRNPRGDGSDISIHTYPYRLWPFLGVHNFEFQYFFFGGGVQKNEYFWGV